jgi:hypothetical protein
MAQINIQVLVTDECRACVKVLQIIHRMRDTMPGLDVEIFNLDEQSVIPDELSAVIVPATYVNKRLFAYGEFEPSALMIFLRRFMRIEYKNINRRSLCGERPEKR